MRAYTRTFSLTVRITRVRHTILSKNITFTYVHAVAYHLISTKKKKKKTLNDAYFPSKCTTRQIKRNYCKIPVPEKRRKHPSTLPTLRPIWNHMQLRHRKT